MTTKYNVSDMYFISQNNLLLVIYHNWPLQTLGKIFFKTIALKYTYIIITEIYMYIEWNLCYLLPVKTGFLKK